MKGLGGTAKRDRFLYTGDFALSDFHHFVQFRPNSRIFSNPAYLLDELPILPVSVASDTFNIFFYHFQNEPFSKFLDASEAENESSSIAEKKLRGQPHLNR